MHAKEMQRTQLRVLLPYGTLIYDQTARTLIYDESANAGICKKRERWFMFKERMQGEHMHERERW